jgi:8-oxo-dGTP pyrophosphatase MutT (NUDIX family)
MNTQTQKLSDQYLDEVTTEFEHYLEKFPEDRGKFDVLQKQLQQKDRDLCDRKNMTGHLTASGLLLNDKRDAVFLIYHNFLKLWLQPGGHLDPQETPMSGALRELVEETGIKNVSLHPWHDSNRIPFDMDTHAIPPNEKKAEGSHFHHDFQYLLVLSQPQSDETAVKIALEEVSHYRWVSLQELIEKEHDDRLKRVAAKICALFPG